MLVWRLWPLSEEELFERGKEQMEKGTLFDMKRAVERLSGAARETIIRTTPYKEEIAEFRQKLEAVKAPTPSEAQRFFQQGELVAKARQSRRPPSRVWSNLIACSAMSRPRRHWVQRAAGRWRTWKKTAESGAVQERTSRAGSGPTSCEPRANMPTPNASGPASSSFTATIPRRGDPAGSPQSPAEIACPNYSPRRTRRPQRDHLCGFA